VRPEICIQGSYCRGIEYVLWGRLTLGRTADRLADVILFGYYGDYFAKVNPSIAKALIKYSNIERSYHPLPSGLVVPRGAVA
jgi:hypothetical protein